MLPRGQMEMMMNRRTTTMSCEGMSLINTTWIVIILYVHSRPGETTF
jgi:hypothetical protein